MPRRRTAVTSSAMKPRRRLAVVTAALAVAGAVVASAGAQTPPPDDIDGVSGVSQYVEALPTAKGPQAPGHGARKTRPLPRRITQKLRESTPKDAALLERIATSSELGAPPAAAAGPGPAVRNGKTRATPAAPPRPRTRPRVRRVAEEREPEPLGPVSAAIGAVGDGDSPRLLVLFGLLAVGTVAAVAAGFRQPPGR